MSIRKKIDFYTYNYTIKYLIHYKMSRAFTFSTRDIVNSYYTPEIPTQWDGGYHETITIGTPFIIKHLQILKSLEKLVEERKHEEIIEEKEMELSEKKREKINIKNGLMIAARGWWKKRIEKKQIKKQLKQLKKQFQEKYRSPKPKNIKQRLPNTPVNYY